MEILKKPFLFLGFDFKTVSLKALAVGLFVTTFLWLFDNGKFGSACYQSLFAYADNGFVVSICLFLSFYLLPKLIVRERLLLWQYFLWVFVSALLTYSVMYLYVTLVYRGWTFSFKTYFDYLISNSPFLFPFVSVVMCLDYIFILKAERGFYVSAKEESYNVNHSIEDEICNTFVFTNESKKEAFTIPKSNILFVKASDNYVEVYHSDNKGAVNRELIRNKLSNIEAYSHNDCLTRIHRSYLCNIKKVIKVSGNSKGYMLHFKETEEAIPVSRIKYQELHKQLPKY